MIPQESLGYDRAITIFAPDGRLYQVEYANEAVKRGTPAIGLKCKDGVIFATYKRTSSKLEDPRYLHKLFKIDDHIGVAISGLHADGRRLVDYARVVAQWHKLSYDEPAPVKLVTKQIGDLEQYYTQHAFARPFGVALIIGGVDSKPELYSTGASGSFWGWKAIAIGAGSDSAQSFLEKNYKFDLDLNDAIKLALKALQKAVKEKMDPILVDVATVSIAEKQYKELPKDEIKKILSKISED
ncbi:MAG: archaeal proteasome endopeptidase complex subunit alpha [Candidatus Asgardarchaeia archaeon]